MRFRFLNSRLFTSECQTRLPFRFGQVTMTRAPLALLEVEIETEAGARCRGYSSDLLAPKWFEKDSAKSLQQDFDTLTQSVQAAQRVASSEAEESAFGLWWRVYQERVSHQPFEAPDRLVRGFGVALLERAVIDAVCRAAETSFFEALEADLLGFRPAVACDELADWQLELAAPLDSVLVRHTVGLVDALERAEVSDSDEVDDDHPVSLEQDIDAYGLRLFKVKLSGDRRDDLERLLRVETVLQAKTFGDYRLTLDGNEQYRSLDELRALVRELEAWPQGQRLLERLLFIEQPLPRALTFDRAFVAGIEAFNGYGGVVIDEADVGLAALSRGAELGYRGVSVKNCKGVFRALLNRGLCEVLSAGGERSLFQTGEDLTNLPVIALQQDLATMAALGLEHVERNGHHYFRGLEHLPQAEVRQALARHDDLYTEVAGTASGEARLAIQDGRLALGSLRCPGYGYDIDVVTADRTLVEQA